MAWDDRIKPAAYTSPGGARVSFAYEDLSRSFDKKTTGFDFPTGVGTYVQDNGRTGYKYPIVAYFSGADCDTEATDFEDALAEPGIGKLDHPVYGTVDVVPYGAVSRRDALKTAANQSVVEVTFWQTIPLAYPIAQNDPASEVLTAAMAAGDSLAGIKVSDFQKFKTAMTRAATTVGNTIARVQSLKASAESYVRDIISQLELGTSGIRGAVLSMVDLINLPTSIKSSFKSKLATYKTLLASVKSAGDYPTTKVVSGAVVIATVATAVEAEFETMPEATEAANDILEIMRDVEEWVGSQPEVDDGESYRPLLTATSLAAGHLVQISFSLKKERRITLDRARTIIDLCAELYGEVDEKLDFLINSNHLSGSDILELQAGREIKYYV